MTEIPSDLELLLRGKIALLEEEKESLLTRNGILHAKVEKCEEQRDKARAGWERNLDRAVAAEAQIKDLKADLRDSNVQRGIAGETIHRLRGEAALAREGKNEAIELTSTALALSRRENAIRLGGR